MLQINNVVLTLQRGCLFNFEYSSMFGGQYSFPECLLRCKIYSYLYLCDCIPYVYPINFPDFVDEIKNATRCNLNHLKCLSRYHCGWYYFMYFLAYNFIVFSNNEKSQTKETYRRIRERTWRFYWLSWVLPVMFVEPVLRSSHLFRHFKRRNYRRLLGNNVSKIKVQL